MSTSRLVPSSRLHCCIEAIGFEFNSLFVTYGYIAPNIENYMSGAWFVSVIVWKITEKVKTCLKVADKCWICSGGT